MRRSRAAGEITLTLALLALLLPLLVLPAVAFIADIFSHADSMVTGSTAAQLHPPSLFSLSARRGGKGGGDKALEGDSGSIWSARALATGVSRPISFSEVPNPGHVGTMLASARRREILGPVSGVHDHVSPFLFRLTMI